MQRTIITPLAVLAGMIALVLLASCTSFFSPIIKFIHSGEITTFQGIVCVGLSGAGFALCYRCLTLLCGYFVPRIDDRPKRNQPLIQNLSRR
ncbi:hypothetical protein DESC_580010 [Desulfosarcina cetonica]|uniref:hypothetical protein n=1 Tax=Desulfosarcina cetonica TaxID=90730 RepID=UPI0006CFE02C|nr:hypothetical protein [Desulfosarcina cetonica]VTR66967.1 hypothetical protein DESC_580010 [Desulfosarcina cetonica]